MKIIDKPRILFSESRMDKMRENKRRFDNFGVHGSIVNGT
jgi:hypothetical protein